ncbi:MAG: hypothetical protein JXQ27_14215, partial [Acidobacteria bacterium]|nr:hypothetical protein [Acidobacteriota bacterium]
VDSSILGETRDIFIHEPLGYEKSGRRYPVLVVLDGESMFSFAAGAVDFLAPGRMPEMIVVGIANTHRERDQWVSLQPDGGYMKFVDFLEKELVPFIDAHYRTQPHRVLYGFCSGASTVMWLLFTRPELFDGYIAAGTGFDQTWYDLGAREFARRDSLGKSFYAVTEGTTPRAQGMPLLRKLLAPAPAGLDWDCVVMEQEEHEPVAAKGLFAGLEFIYRRWRLPVATAAAGPPAIQVYYKALGQAYGFDCGLPREPVLNAGLSLLWYEKKPEEAITLFRFLTTKAPRWPDAFEALGVAYQSAGRLAEARQAFEAALAIVRETGDRRRPLFEDYVTSIQEKQE